MAGYPKKIASTCYWLYGSVFTPKWKRDDMAWLEMAFSLRRISAAIAAGLWVEGGFGLNCELFELSYFWMGLWDGFMVLLPFQFKSLKKFAVNILSFEVFVVFFHFGDAAMFFHHFLEVASALRGGSGGEILCERFENLTGPEYVKKGTFSYVWSWKSLENSVHICKILNFPIRSTCPNFLPLGLRCRKILGLLRLI